MSARCKNTEFYLLSCGNISEKKKSVQSVDNHDLFPNVRRPCTTPERCAFTNKQLQSACTQFSPLIATRYFPRGHEQGVSSRWKVRFPIRLENKEKSNATSRRFPAKFTRSQNRSSPAATGEKSWDIVYMDPSLESTRPDVEKTTQREPLRHITPSGNLVTTFAEKEREKERERGKVDSRDSSHPKIGDSVT